MTDPTTAQLTTDPGYRLEYIVTDEAWYADAHRKVSPHPEITVSKAALAGGCAWEFKVVYREFQTDDRQAVQVRIFDDAFNAFNEISPFFQDLAAQQPSTLDGVRVILDRLGFTDATEREQPVYGDAAAYDIAGEPTR